MTYEHPWLSIYPIDTNSKYLIIGTHPPMPYCGRLEYYYGNMSEFWRFLDLVYPDNKLYDNGCPKREDIIKFLTNNNFSITDMVYKTHIERFSTDIEMGKVVFEDLNPFLKDWIENSNINTIYFTSFGGTNSAKNLFKKWYKKVYNETSKIDNNAHINKISIKGNELKLIDLYSPSPTARRGLPRSKDFQLWESETKQYKGFDAFRVYWYNKYLPKII